MEKPYDEPFSICRELDCFPADRQDRGHYHVRRIDGEGEEWIICQNGEMLWKMGPQDSEVHMESDAPRIPPFPSVEDAAWFACMHGRFYRAEVREPSKLHIRVSPNFGKWAHPLGNWVASLHEVNGSFANIRDNQNRFFGPDRVAVATKAYRAATGAPWDDAHTIALEWKDRKISSLPEDDYVRKYVYRV